MELREVIKGLSLDLAELVGEVPHVAVRARRGWPRPDRSFEVMISTSRHRVVMSHSSALTAIQMAFQRLRSDVESEARVVPIRVVQSKRSA